MSRGNTLMEIAERLKKARAAKYPSAAAASRALGMKEPTVQAHEQGRNGIPANIFLDYCKAYNVDPSWLMSGQASPSYETSSISGVILTVAGRLQQGTFSEDPAAALDEEDRTLEIPGFDVGSNVEVFEVYGDHAKAHYPSGTYLIVSPAHRLAIRNNDHVVVERRRAGLVELTAQQIRSGPDGLQLVSLAIEDAPPQPMGEGALVRGVISGFYRRVPRPGSPSSTLQDVPKLEREEAPLAAWVPTRESLQAPSEG